MNDAFLSLGTNEGDRIGWLKKAIEQLADCCGDIIAFSSVYETAAWGITDQADFLNMAVHIHTLLSPEDLLNEILNIEIVLGRKREIKWGPRIIDIDILLYNYEIIDTNTLTIPHPFLHERRFVLVPLAEISPKYIHPKLNINVSDLLLACADTLEVHFKQQLF